MVVSSNVVLALRVTATVFLVFTPTLMYLGLIRLLEWMRNDELILELANHPELQTTGTEEMLAALGEDGGRESDSGESGPTVRCPSCGYRNPKDVTYCAGCLVPLD
jgi:hypothetical protein